MWCVNEEKWQKKGSTFGDDRVIRPKKLQSFVSYKARRWLLALRDQTLSLYYFLDVPAATPNFEMIEPRQNCHGQAHTISVLVGRSLRTRHLFIIFHFPGCSRVNRAWWWTSSQWKCVAMALNLFQSLLFQRKSEIANHSDAKWKRRRSFTLV